MNDGWIKNAVFIFSGMGGFALIAHAVNSFPVPVNKYGQWLLGVVQFAVGQRIQGKANVIEGANK